MIYQESTGAPRGTSLPAGPTTKNANSSTRESSQPTNTTESATTSPQSSLRNLATKRLASTLTNEHRAHRSRLLFRACSRRRSRHQSGQHVVDAISRFVQQRQPLCSILEHRQRCDVHQRLANLSIHFGDQRHLLFRAFVVVILIARRKIKQQRQPAQNSNR